MSEAALETTARPPKNFGSALQYGIFACLLRFPGLGFCRLLLRLVVGWYTLLPHGRRRGLPYLSRRFGAAGFGKRLRQSWNLNHLFGTVLLERLYLDSSGRGGVLAREDDSRALRGLLDHGRGLILLSAHVGGWQGAAQGLGFLGRTVNILQYRTRNHGDQRVFVSGGRGAAVRVIPMQSGFGGLVDVHAALSRGEVACLMGDRVMGREKSCAVPFLGGNVRLPLAPYRLAALADCALVFAFVLRENFGPENSPHPHGANLRLHLARVFPPPSQGGMPPAEGMAAAFARELEAVVTRHPYQFFNFYDIWERGN